MRGDADADADGGEDDDDDVRLQQVRTACTTGPASAYHSNAFVPRSAKKRPQYSFDRNSSIVLGNMREEEEELEGEENEPLPAAAGEREDAIQERRARERQKSGGRVGRCKDERAQLSRSATRIKNVGEKFPSPHPLQTQNRDLFTSSRLRAMQRLIRPAAGLKRASSLTSCTARSAGAAHLSSARAVVCALPTSACPSRLPASSSTVVSAASGGSLRVLRAVPATGAGWQLAMAYADVIDDL